VAWAYLNDGLITAADQKITVNMVVVANGLAIVLCNGTAGNLTLSGHGTIAWRVLP
jgi:hypothetical protein